MRARSLGVASFIIIAPLAALALDARSLKQGTIADLDGHRTGSTALDSKIDEAIQHIQNSLALPDGTSLFTAEDTIAPPATGTIVFDEEQKALDSLSPVAGDSLTPLATKDAIARVSSTLAIADRRIAAKAIDRAATYLNGLQAETRLDQARKDLAKGDSDFAGGAFKMAISDYESTWQDAARSILESNPAPVVSGLTPPAGSYVRTNQPLLGATVETVLDLLQLDPKSIVLLLDGTAIVDGGTGLRTSAITFDAFAGRATISLQAPSVLAEGTHTLTVRASATQRSNTNLGVGNVGPTSVEKSWTFFVETRPPVLTLAPADGTTIETETPTIAVSYVDPSPGSGVNLASLKISLDSVDVTSRFVVTSASATWMVPDALFLSQGVHVLDVSVSDNAGNPASARSTFVVDTHPVALAISISPSLPSHVEAGSLNDVTVRWVTLHGATSLHATGFVLLTCTDHRSPLDGMVLQFVASDQGSKTIPQLAAFLTADVQTVTATSLPTDGSRPLTGSLTVNLVPGPAAVLLFTRGGADERLLASETPSPFAVAIDDAFGNRRSDTGTTVIANVLQIGSTNPPILLTSAIDATTTASFTVPQLDVGSYLVVVSVPSFPAVPALTYHVDVVFPPVGDIFIRFPRTPVAAGQSFDADVFLNVGPDDGDPAHVLGGYDVCLSFDPARLAIDGVEPVAQTGPYFRTNLQKPGFLAVSALNATADGSDTAAPVSGLAELFTVHCHALATAPNGVTPVGAEVWDVVASSLVSPAIHLGSPTPRPATGGIVVVASGNGPSFTLSTLGVSPLTDTAGIVSSTTFSVLFSDAVDEASLPGGIELIRGVDNVSLPVQITTATSGRQVVVQPVALLEPSRRYILVAHTSVRSRTGATLATELESAWFTGQVGTSEDFDADGRQSVADALVARGVMATGFGLALPESAADSDAKTPGGAGFAGVLDLSEPLQVGKPLPPPGTPGTISPTAISPSRGAVVDQHEPYPRRNRPVTASITAADGTRVDFTEAANRLGWAGTRAFVPPIFAGTGPTDRFPDGDATVTVVDESVSTIACVDTHVPEIDVGGFRFQPIRWTNGPVEVTKFTVADPHTGLFHSCGLSRVEIVQFSGGFPTDPASYTNAVWHYDLPKADIFDLSDQDLTQAQRTFTVPNNGISKFRFKVIDRAGLSASIPDPSQFPNNPWFELRLDTAVPSLVRFLTVTNDHFDTFDAVPQNLSNPVNPVFTRQFVQFKVIAQDQDSGLDRVELLRRLPDGTYAVVDTQKLGAPTGGPTDAETVTLTDNGAPEGLQLYRVRAFDVAGNFAEAPDPLGLAVIPVLFDRTFPVGSISAPRPVTSVSGASIVATWGDPAPAVGVTPSGVGHVILRRVSPPAFYEFFPMGRDGSTSFPDNPPDGDYTYYLQLEDNSHNFVDGQGRTGYSTTVIYDRTPPLVTFQTTKSDLTKADGSINVLITDRTNITNVIVAVGSTANPPQAAPTITPYTITPANDTTLVNPSSATVTIPIDTLPFADGGVTVTISATDSPGGRTGTATRTFLVDRVPPTLSITKPASGLRTNQSTVAIAGIWSDTTSGIDLAHASFQLVRRSDRATFSVAPPATLTPQGFSGTMAVPDGDFDFVVTVSDLAGNSTTASTRLVVDTVPPVVTVSVASTIYQAGRAPITGTLHDATSGVDPTTFRLRLDGQDLTPTTVLRSGANLGDLTFRFDPDPPIGDGVHSVVALVVDEVGNVGSASATLVVDGIPPTTPGSPVGAPRPLDGRVSISWLPSVDLGANASGLDHYLVERSDDEFQTIASATTATTNSIVLPPVLPGSRYRVRAVDRAGNQSDAVDVNACEAFCIEQLGTTTTTKLRVAVVDQTGTAITDAQVFVEPSGPQLGYVGGGLYELANITTSTSTSVSLRAEAPTPLGTVIVRSGSLLAMPDLTDFGDMVVRIPGIESAVVSSGGVAPFDSSTSPGDFYAGATVGEAAVGPLGDLTSPTRVNAGFWHVTDTPAPYVYVTVLLMPPVVCCPNVPIYYAIFSEDTSQGYDVVIQFSPDGGASWTRARGTSGGEPTTGLLAAPGGMRHVFLWDAGTDLANLTAAGVQVRLYVAPPLGDPTQVATGGFIYRLQPPPAVVIRGGALQPGPTTYGIALAPGFANAVLTLTGSGATFGNGSLSTTLGNGGTFTLSPSGTGLDVLQVFVDGVLVAVLPVGSAPPDVVALSAPSTITGVASLTYSVRHPTAALADVLVEYDPTGTGVYHRATQAGSPPGSGFDGVQGVSTSPGSAGRQHLFLWDSAADLRGVDLATVQVRVSARVGSGPTGLAQTTSLTVDNGPSFGDPHFYAAGSAPRAVIVADVNRDGIPDIVTADRNGGTVSVLFGRGNGTFAPPIHYQVGTQPAALAAADLNGDGRLDLVVANEGTNDVSVLLGTPTGFAPAVQIPVGNGPRAIALADVNGDRIPDLIVASSFENAVSVAFGHGDGTFSAPVAYPAGVQPTSIAIADFDRDGRLDIAVASEQSGKVLLLFGAPGGTFRAPIGVATFGQVTSLLATDLDLDGSPDLVLTSAVNHTVAFLHGNGNGTFAAPVSYLAGSCPMGVAVGDFNGDGLPDLVTADDDSGQLGVVRGTGIGVFAAPRNFAGEPGLSSVAVADLDGDGRLDLVGGSETGSQVVVVLGTRVDRRGPALDAAIAAGIGTAPRALVARDVNGDGKLDLVVADDVAGLTVLLGNGDATYQAPIKLAAGLARPMAIACGDVNGDGRLDVALVNQEDSVVSLCLGNGDGTFSQASTLGVGSVPMSVAILDVNGDGRADIVTANESGTVSVLLGNGDGTFRPAADYAVPGRPRAVAIGDVNRDGLLDLVVSSDVDGGAVVAVLLGRTDWTFSAATTFPSGGTGGGGIALADLDRDGILDVVVANSSSQSVGVLRGRGDGTFGAPALLATGPVPTDLAVGDLDGDGLLDVAVTSFGGNAVSVFLGDGAGSLRPAGTIAVGQNPLALVAADLNGDGLLDLAAATVGASQVTVLRGLGNGTFHSGSDWTAGPTPVATALADLDGDGVLDSIAAEFSGTVTVRLGVGGGNFGPPASYASGTNPIDVRVADLNGDGKPDVVVLDAYEGTVSVFLGLGDGTLQSPLSFPCGASPRRLALADVDGDGKVDVVVAVAGGDAIAILKGNGDGTLASAVTISVGARPADVVVADLDNDGTQDIAVSLAGAASVAVLHGRGGLLFDAPVSYGVGVAPDRLLARDVDGDGSLDLVVACSGSDSVSVLLGNGDGTFRAGPTVATVPAPSGLAVADMDRDGRLDLVVASRAADAVVVHHALATGGFEPLGSGFRTAHEPTDLVLGDVDGDGWQDVVVAADLGPALSVLERGRDSTYDRPARISTGSRIEAVALADVNGDGLRDLIVANRDLATISVRLGRGDGTFGPPIDAGTAAGPCALVVADFDGDGHLDVAVACRDANVVSVLRGNGDGTFQPRTDDPSGAMPVAIALGDFDRDGRLDLVTADAQSNTVSILRGLGGGAFAPRTALPVGQSPSSVAVADVNGDGFLDIAASNEASATITLYSGRGDGTFGPPGTLGAGGLLPRAIAVGDVTRDGHADLVTANSGSDDVSLLPGVLFSPVQTQATGGSQPVVLALADLDGDGHIEVVVANAGTGDISILERLATTFHREVIGGAGFSPSALAVGDVNGDGKPDIVVVGEGGAISVFLHAQTLPLGVASIVVSGFPPTIQAGVPALATISARDALGNVVPSYRGTVHVSSTDLRAVLPADFVFTATDAGTRVGPITLSTAGSWSISATDVATSLTGEQSPIVVTPAPASALALSGLAPSVIGGIPSTVTVTAIDAFGNRATGYAGTVQLASSDTAATLPPPHTFTAGDGGRFTFSFVLRAAGPQSLAASDGSSSASSPVVVVADALRVVTVTPTAGQQGVDAGTSIVLRFNAPVDPTTVPSSILLRDLSTRATIGATATLSGSSVTLAPTNPLPGGEWAEVVVLATLRGADGTAFNQAPLSLSTTPAPFSSSFRVLGGDSAPPALVSSVPANGASAIPPASSITLVFDKALDPASVSATTISVVSTSTLPTTLTLSPDHATVMVAPTSPLPGPYPITVTIAPTIRSAAGVALGVTTSVVFTTAPTAAPPPVPAILTPADGTTLHATSILVTGRIDLPEPALARLLLDGNPTPTIALIDSNTGAFSIQSPALADGSYEVRIRAERFDGTASAASNPVTVRLDNYVPPTTPPGTIVVHELIAGRFADPADPTQPPIDRAILDFHVTGENGRSFQVKVVPIPFSLGPRVSAQIVAQGASFDVIKGQQLYGNPGQLTFGPQGVGIEFRACDMVGEKYQVSLIDDTNTQVGEIHEVRIVAPTAVVVDQAAADCCQSRQLFISVRGTVAMNCGTLAGFRTASGFISTNGYSTSTQTSAIYPVANHTIRVASLDLNTKQPVPAEFTPANDPSAAPSIGGILLTTDEKGNVCVNVCATPPVDLAVSDPGSQKPREDVYNLPDDPSGAQGFSFSIDGSGGVPTITSITGFAIFRPNLVCDITANDGNPGEIQYRQVSPTNGQLWLSQPDGSLLGRSTTSFNAPYSRHRTIAASGIYRIQGTISCSGVMVRQNFTSITFKLGSETVTSAASPPPTFTFNHHFERKVALRSGDLVSLSFVGEFETWSGYWNTYLVGAGVTATPEEATLDDTPLADDTFDFPPKGPQVISIDTDQPAPDQNPPNDRPEDQRPNGMCDPVTFNNGQLYLERVDMAVPGRGVASFSFSRTYKSEVLYDGPLGVGWNHGYDMRVSQDSNGAVTWLTGGNRSEVFAPTSGGWKSPVGVFEKLLVENGQLVIRAPNGVRHVFRRLDDLIAPGALQQIVDADGNALRFEYGTDGIELGRLVRVIDSYDRVFTLAYNTRGRIKSVTDETLNRSVQYVYTESGDLAKVTSPISTTTTTGDFDLLDVQKFPNGRSEIYAYTCGLESEMINHKLLLVIAPNEAQFVPDDRLDDKDFLRQYAQTENTWNMNVESPWFGRIMSQRWGGTNATGLQAGGTFTFDYTDLLNPMPSTIQIGVSATAQNGSTSTIRVATPPQKRDLSSVGTNEPISITKVKDRNGNVVEFYNNKLGNAVKVREYANRNLRPRGTGPGQDPEYFETQNEYDDDGLLLLTRRPLGGEVHKVYDKSNPDRNGQANLRQETRVPDARGDSRGGSTALTKTYVYEPVFNQVCKITDERGNDSSYLPQNGQPWSADRYSTRFFFDYQQSMDAVNTLPALAAQAGLDPNVLSARLTVSQVDLYRGDLNEDPSDNELRGGHVVKVQAPTVTRPNLPPQEIVTLESHNRYGQTTRVVDAEKNVHTYGYHPSYDPDGDGVPVVGTKQTDPTGGYLAVQNTDTTSDSRREGGRNPEPVNLTTRLYYDAVGHVVRKIDPRGIEHRSWFSMDDDAVRTVSATAVASSCDLRDRALAPPSYEVLTIHDANGNAIETRISNQGERDGTAQSVAANPYWTTRRRFDILDNVVAVIQEVEPIADDSSITESSPGVLVTRVGYDANENVTLVTQPEGNSVLTVYDERNKPFLITRGFGSPQASTTKHYYDLNGNALYTVSAVKKNPSKNTEFLDGDVTKREYDGFDRLVCTMDAEGNCGDTVFDPVGNKVRHVSYGPPEEGAPRIAEAQWLYDEAGRPFRTDVHVFSLSSTASTTRTFDRTIPTIATQAYPVEEFATSTRDFDALGRVTRELDPRGQDALAEYDGASRATRKIMPVVTDRGGQNPVRSEVQIFYDGNANQIHRVEIDRSPLANVPAETFQSDSVYDAVNRVIRTTDNAGQTMRMFYDSRSNLIVTTDAKSSAPLVPDPLALRAGPGTLINDHGNVTRIYYDGASRPIRSERLMKIGGKGDGQPNLDRETNLDTTNPTIPTGIVTTRTYYDKNGRVTAQTDPNGNASAYGYDALDRAEMATFSDGTYATTTYDADDDVTETTDPNGSVVHNTYDGLGRLTKTQVLSRATNLAGTTQSVVGTTLQAFEYDGFSRTRASIDDNGDALNLGVGCEVEYDSLGRVLSETHSINATVAAYDVPTTNHRLSITPRTIQKRVKSTYALAASGLVSTIRTGLEYTTSGRKLTFGLDGLGRPQRVLYGSLELAGYEYVGDRAKEKHLNTQGSSPSITTCTYSYDSSRRVNRIEHVTSGGSRVAGFAYDYDFSNLRTFEQDLRLAGAPQQQYAYDSLGHVTNVRFGVTPSNGPTRTTSYVIDGAHNFAQRVDQVTGQDPVTTAYNRQPTGAFAPDAVNRNVRIDTFLATALAQTETPIHDAAGARIQDARRHLWFDAFDRLVRVDRNVGGTFQTVGQYTYDAAGRRVTKISPTERLAYVNDGMQEIEEVDLDTGALVAENVFGSLYVDEPVLTHRGGQDYYLHTNASFNVVAVTDASGSVVERYDYGSIYGAHTVTDRDGNALAASSIQNPWRFQGRRWDEESGLFFCRARYLDPEEGRFVNRDPKGLWGASGSNGNGYAFCLGDPVNGVDPLGLESKGILCAVLNAKDWESTWMGALQALGEDLRAIPGALSDGFEKAVSLGDQALHDPGSIATMAQYELGAAKNGINQALTPPRTADPNEDPTSAPLTTAGAIAAGNQQAIQTGAAAAVALASIYVSAPFLDAVGGAAIAGLGKVASVIADGASTLMRGGLEAAGAVMGFTARAARAAAQGTRLEGLMDTAGRMGSAIQNGLKAAHNFVKCDALKIACFLEGTQVSLGEHGEAKKPIEQVKTGDLVTARNEVTGKVSAQPVGQLFPGWTDRVVHLRLVSREAARARTRTSSGDESESSSSEEPPVQQEIRCTPTHPFYVEGRGWVGAAQLREGDVLVALESGIRVEVGAVEVRAERARTYNFEVVGDHTYFVAARPDAPAVWVHNACTPEVVEFNPRGKNIIFKETELNAGQLREKWPFRHDLSEANMPNLVKHGDEFHVMQGNHRVWTAQNPPEGGPLTIKVKVWTPEQWAEHSQMPFVPGRGTNNPKLPPIANPKKDWW
jgi:RHS repeat-associated protein